MRVTNFKLAIGLPLVSNQVHTAFLDSWVLLEKPDYVYIRPDFPCAIAAARNGIVEQALSAACTHIIMMDTDQSYPPDTITKLLAHNLPAVAAKVHRRYPPFDPILFRWDEAAGLHYLLGDEEWYGKDIIKVDATGGGCFLCESKVYMDIEPPWFEVKELVTKQREIKTVGEDVGFWMKVKEAGYKLVVDLSIPITHMGTLEIDEKVYFLNKKLKTLQKGGGT